MRAHVGVVVGLALSVTSLIPVPALAQRNGSDYRPGERFDTIKTFSFKPGETVDTSGQQKTIYDSPFVRERTEAAVASQLERRGWKRDDRNPDVYVTVYRTFRTETTVYNTGSPYWGPYGWGGYGWAGYWDGWPGWNSWYTVETLKGDLTVDIADAETGQLLWRGAGEKTVHNHKHVEHRIEHVNNEVDEVFEKFPGR